MTRLLVSLSRFYIEKFIKREEIKNGKDYVG